MPPHCDSLDGPVVSAARRALAAGDADLVLPYVPAAGEDEVRTAFHRVLPLQADGGEAAAVAQLWFFETVVRIHRAGEGAPYTGLKPAGLDAGPVIPLAEKAVETGDGEPVHRFLAEELHAELTDRLQRVGQLAAAKDASLPAARAHVQAMLGFQVYAHHVHRAVRAAPHEHG